MSTSHRQQPGEMRGKASNVDWAAREAVLEFRRLGELVPGYGSCTKSQSLRRVEAVSSLSIESPFSWLQLGHMSAR
jgi:hypothetical protein